jgi:hypothetical protein
MADSRSGLPPGPVHVGASADGFNSISFLVCSEAGVINDLQIRLLAGGGSTAMWMFGLNKDNDFRYNRLNPDITSDLYSVGSC